jgi:hypothetical protein
LDLGWATDTPTRSFDYSDGWLASSRFGVPWTTSGKIDKITFESTGK